MSYMLVRNTVRDFATWKAVFDQEVAGRAHEAGLELVNLWRSVDDPNEVFFLFRMTDVDRAKAYVASPDSARAGEQAGATGGEIWYVDRVT